MSEEWIPTDEEWNELEARIAKMKTPANRRKEAFLYYFYGAVAILILIAMLAVGQAIGAPIFNPGKPPGTP